MYYVNPKKQEREQEKLSTELIELHKRCILDYLITYKDIKHKTKKKFFRLYDYYINEDNIRHYFFRPINVFVACLVRNELDKIEDYIKSENHGRKKKTRKTKNKRA